MTTGYGLDCPIASALDVIGERWSLLILRDLFRFGPRRFVDLQVSLKGIAPNTLSARLKTLEAQGVVAGHMYERHPPRLEYRLTAKGKELGPVLKALYNWGERHGPKAGAAAANDALPVTRRGTARG
jgi:DNA-binding HxlR family transcriptional regulator